MNACKNPSYGIVQGVGFRPFIYRIAARVKITNW
ncbi:acylphosphatase [Candidatus Bathyarchaeota archaeon]|nr:acylphosphatase [Candidatus Bathyarchaeota archaeon]